MQAEAEALAHYYGGGLSFTVSSAVSAPFTSASAGWPPTPQEQQLRKCRTGCFLYLLAMGRLYLRFVTTCRAGDVSLALVEVECEASVPQAGADAVAASRPDEAFKAKNL